MRHLLFLTLSLFILGACSHKQEEETEPQPVALAIDTVPMLVMQIQKCSKLYTAEYRIHKIVTHDDVLRLKGTILQQAFNIRMPLGDRKIAIPMDATLKAYIDFSQFSRENIERQGEHITILLPDPKVALTSSKVDQKNIREYVSLTRSHFTDAEMSNYEQQGRAAILASVPRLGIMEMARQNAARVLIPMLVEMGYREENVTIAFRKQFGAGDLRTLLDPTQERAHE